jgi:DNA-binding GntR family transcriptional regulator
MLEQIRDDRHFVDRDAFLAANKAYHAAVIAIADNEHLSVGFEMLKLRQLYRAALKDTTLSAENVVHFHEFLTDAIAAGDVTGAMQAVRSWSKNAASRAMRVIGDFSGEAAREEDLRMSGIVEDLSIAAAKEQVDLAGDVDALVQALDARAALEIGITQSLGHALSIETPRNALVARLRAFTPLVRGTSSAHVARYIRADDAFHRVFLSLLRNPRLFEIYNSMDLPELMRRVLEVAPPSIREVFDDHKGLTNALRAGDVEKTCAAITEHANRMRAALSDFLAKSQAEQSNGALVGDVAESS